MKQTECKTMPFLGSVKFSGNRQDFTCPSNNIEVYQLATFIETILLDEYRQLLDHMEDGNDGAMLKKVISFQENEILQLEKELKFELNCELAHFYESGGMEPSSSIDHGYLENELERIYYAFEAFRQELIGSSWDALFTITDEDGYEGKKSEVFINCLRSRDSAVGFLRYLVGIYPQGKESQTMKEIADLIHVGSAELVKRFITIV